MHEYFTEINIPLIKHFTLALGSINMYCFNMKTNTLLSIKWTKPSNIELIHG